VNDTVKARLKTALWILGIGTVLTILAPYGTQAMSLGGRWIYWSGLVGVGWLSGFAINHHLPSQFDEWPFAARIAMIATLVSLPVTACVALLEVLLDDPYPLSALPIVFALVWVISIAISTVASRSGAPVSAPEFVEPQIGRALLDKLSPKLQRAELRALAAEDHYLRVHTDAGDELILMRLSDAIAALEGIDGAQTHRSWWVARKAIETVDREKGRARLNLAGGIEAPVSRTYLPALKEAGWF